MQPYGYGTSWFLASDYGSYFKGVAVLLVGVALSMLWHWWGFIFALFIAGFVLKGRRQGTVDNAAKILAENPTAFQHFVRSGVVWEADAKHVVPEG